MENQGAKAMANRLEHLVKELSAILGCDASWILDALRGKSSAELKELQIAMKIILLHEQSRTAEAV